MDDEDDPLVRTVTNVVFAFLIVTVAYLMYILFIRGWLC